ncbi:LacI family transcriptional regulator [Longispora fulva]|uniref:LacI family transcriptional regulator n=1 Tax=Longispora fulva TaxID=619741 RepID=A0A8J7GFN1_9ACTN|nr:LacI family DNA-binding transcriptional regulator [Longispora fulva]MBG6136916.1 LacI family transcriptional regulator [Longispora fulva]GIG61732.1 LacI family transcriptional regulator [Longispora fulva]
MTRQPTLNDVAVAAGVSLATASRVLNGSDRKVSATLHDRVMAAAQALHYTANAQAQALARRSTALVGLLLHDIADPYFSGIASGVLSAAVARDLRVVIADTGADPDAAVAHLSALRGERARAAILVGSRTTDRAGEKRLAEAIGQFTAAGARMVCVGQPGLPGDTVVPDNRGGARALGAHLSGHARVAIVAGPDRLRTVRDRVAGFRAGLGHPETTLVSAEFSRDGGYGAAAHIPDGTTAVFVTSDVMATGLCTGLRERGLRIPEDIAVAGFDDIPVIRDLHPALTTVALPLADMGSQALHLALAEDGPSRTVTIPTRLVIRDSTSTGS